MATGTGSLQAGAAVLTGTGRIYPSLQFRTIKAERENRVITVEADAAGRLYSVPGRTRAEAEADATG